MNNLHPHLPLGVCLLREPDPNGPRTLRYSHYVHEILDHAGIPYVPLSVDELGGALSGLRLLLTVGEAQMPDELGRRLEDWVSGGGVWIGVSGVCGRGELFGVEVLPPTWTLHGLKIGTLGEGYLKPRDPSHKLLEHLSIPLHYFGGIPVRAAGAQVLAEAIDVHQRPTDRAALTENCVGSGRCMLISPDLTGSVVRIQQGIGMTRDGVSAPDGTAWVDDCVGKTDDGCVLDWIFDRQPVDGVDGFSAFLQPIADQWRELLVRAILYACSTAGVALPVLWLYPRNLPALGHISHDTDGCEVERAESMLRAMAKAGINTTWCVILPGYPAEVIDAIRDAGHELATHYDAMTEGCEWGRTEFDDTVHKLAAIFGDSKPVTNKNHYLRWEGDTEFFDWCFANGIQLDQSKGPSKSGNVGFAFGTCHPYFPVDPAGRVIDVLELPTLTQDLLIMAPRELSKHLVAGAAKHHGVMHVLHHPAHIDKLGIADALWEAIELGRQQGMEFWTARRINDWERARRTVTWQGWTETPASAECTLSTASELSEATIMWLSDSAAAVTTDGEAQQSAHVERWGFRFASVTVDLHPGIGRRLRVRTGASQ